MEIFGIPVTALEIGYVMGGIAGFSVTATVKADRKDRPEVNNLTRPQLRVYSGFFAAGMTWIVLFAFTEIPFPQILAHGACSAVAWPSVIALFMIALEKKMPGAAKALERAAAGSTSLDDTTITK